MLCICLQVNFSKAFLVSRCKKRTLRESFWYINEHRCATTSLCACELRISTKANHKLWKHWLKNIVCCLNMEGLLVQIHKTFVCVFSTLKQHEKKKKLEEKPQEKWMFCIRATSAFHNIRPRVYVAMWQKPLYVLWRRLAFFAFIKLSSHWYCLWYSEREGAKITQYKRGNNSLGLCLLYLSSLDKINNLLFAICFHKQMSSHEDILPEIVLLFHLKHWIHK